MKNEICFLGSQQLQHQSSSIPIKTYEEIPKVKGVIPSLTIVIPFITKKYNRSTLHKFFDDRVKEYGPIYRENVAM